MLMQLLNYSDKCFKTLTNTLCGVEKRCDTESVHRLRLAIKKLRTLLGILNYKEGISAIKKNMKAIDRIFIFSGLVRDNQIQVELLENYRSRVGEEVDLLAKKFKKDNRKCKEAIRLKIKKINLFDLVLLNQMIDNEFETLTDSAIEIILREKANKLFDEINQIAKNNPDEKALHRIRTMLKELVYTLIIIKKGKGKFKVEKSTLIYFDNLQQILGDWHDLEVLFKSVNQHRFELAKLAKIVEFDKEAKRLDVLFELEKTGGIRLYK